MAESMPDAMSVDGLTAAQRELLRAELEASLALARTQLSLVRGSLATVTAHLARPFDES